jgi:predicted RNA binding protein YcfA (HicA-like mRNA interferase family)
MGKYQKLFSQILHGRSDANVEFGELCRLLEKLGFQCRTRGSHSIFFRPDVEELINLQSSGRKAKPYQVRQIRNIILKYNLGDEI